MLLLLQVSEIFPSLFIYGSRFVCALVPRGISARNLFRLSEMPAKNGNLISNADL